MNIIHAYQKYKNLTGCGYESISLHEVMNDLYSGMTPKQRIRANKMIKKDEI